MIPSARLSAAQRILTKPDKPRIRYSRFAKAWIVLHKGNFIGSASGYPTLAVCLELVRRWYAWGPKGKA